MPNPLQDVFNLLRGSPETGRGILSPGNIMDVLRAPVDTQRLPQIPSQLGDLGRINVVAPNQASGEPLPQSPLPPSIPQPSPSQGQTGQRSQLMDILLKLGVPLATTAIGQFVPGALPGAAGFQTGYAQGMEKEEEKKKQKDFIVIDPETGETQTFKVPKGASVQQKRTDQGNILDKLISSELGIKMPETKTGDAAKQAQQKAKGIREFKTVEEAEKANLPVGTKVTIKGRSATIQ